MRMVLQVRISTGSFVETQEYFTASVLTQGKRVAYLGKVTIREIRLHNRGLSWLYF